MCALPRHPRVRRQHAARGVRAAAGYLPRLRTALRDRGDGCRSYHAVVERRADDSKQLPNAVQGMQPAKVEQIGGEADEY